MKSFLANLATGLFIVVLVLAGYLLVLCAPLAILAFGLVVCFFVVHFEPKAAFILFAFFIYVATMSLKLMPAYHFWLFKQP